MILIPLLARVVFICLATSQLTRMAVHSTVMDLLPGSRIVRNASTGGLEATVNTGSSSTGWFVLDNIRGRFSFEGLTLKTRTINSGFLGDGALFDSEVLEVGLPNTLNYENVSLTVANSNTPRPTDAGFQQTDIFTLNINGQANLQGNLLVYPTGTP